MTMTDNSDIVLSVIVPALNAEDTIVEQLDAIGSQKPGVPWEVIVVDNGSTDNTRRIVADYLTNHPTWRGVAATNRHHLSYARNLGVAEARGRYVAFCDADDVVGRGWAAALVQALNNHALVAYALEYDRLNEPSALSGRARFQSNSLGTVLGRPVASGPMGVHRDLWLRSGGNDESLDFPGEDFEFVLRLGRDFGVEPFFAADAVYHYRLRDDARSVFRQARGTGYSHVALAARFAEQPPPPRERLREGARGWWWVATRAPVALVRPERRTVWARRAGIRVGRARASARLRVLYP
jgi:glycosyltransferase involved in cell wall biosynthesis